MESKLEILINEFNKKEDILLIYLFGSYSKETQNKLSDIDFAILLHQNAKDFYFNKQMEYLGLLIDIFRRDDIDLVILNSAPLLLQFKVVKSGKLIYAKNELTRIRFEENVIRNYLDMKSLYDYYNKYLIRRIDEGKFGVR